jgi:hypothetical protein
MDHTEEELAAKMRKTEPEGRVRSMPKAARKDEPERERASATRKWRGELREPAVCRSQLSLRTCSPRRCLLPAATGFGHGFTRIGKGKGHAPAEQGGYSRERP